MTSVHMDIEGLDKLVGQLTKLGAESDDVMANVVTELVVKTHDFAVSGMAAGHATGRVYEFEYWTDKQGRLRQGRPRVPHRASSPGQYPASDTGRLASSIGQQFPTAGNIVGKVGTDLIYGAYLEFGTSRMDARPWLLPSFEKAKIGVTKELKEEIRRLTRG